MCKRDHNQDHNLFDHNRKRIEDANRASRAFSAFYPRWSTGCGVRVDVALGERDLSARDVEATTLPEELRSLSERARKVLPSGQWNNVPGNGRCSGFEKVPGNFRCSGLVACSGFGACAHVARLVRVDVAAGELHVAARDVEAAALPEEWRSLSEGSRKVLPSGQWIGAGAGAAC